MNFDRINLYLRLSKMQNVKSICVIFLLFKIKYRFTNRSCVETPVATLVFANGKFKSDIKFLFHPVYISKQMYVELKLWHFILFSAITKLKFSVMNMIYAEINLWSFKSA